MALTIEAAVNQNETTLAGGRMATVLLRGVSVQIPCPSWCELEHATVSENFLEDIYHSGRVQHLTAPTFNGTEQVMTAWVTQYPFSDHPAPYMALDASGDGEMAELTPEAALAFADQLVAHAAQIRRMAHRIQGGAA